MTLRKFSQLFSSWQQAWEASAEEIQQKIRLPRNINFAQRKDIDPEKLWKLKEKLNIQLLLEHDLNYPPLLKQIPTPPFLLYVRGNLQTLSTPSLAIVGSRSHSDYGAHMLEKIIPNLCAAGLTVVSGLAIGIDRIAHSLTLNEGGATIAVEGCGVDQIYPTSNQRLGEDLLKTKQGAIISDFALGTPAKPEHFPMRNRIVSGLSLGTLVVEAKKKSGSLITANLAVEQNREVFALPGSVLHPNSQGCHALIQKGAKLITSAEDILQELNIEAKKQIAMAEKILGDTQEEQQVIDLLTNEALHTDHLIRQLDRTAAQTLPLLTMMEMKGQIRHLGGGIYTLQ